MSSQFPHPWSKLAINYRELRRKLPILATNIAVNTFKRNFRNEGYTDSTGLHKWQKRKIEDAGRGILTKTGRLKRGLKAAPDYNFARVINNVPYAEVHNEGLQVKATYTVRAFKRKNGRVVKSHKRKINFKMPMRAFMITTQPLLDDINKMVDTKLTELWNKTPDQ